MDARVLFVSPHPDDVKIVSRMLESVHIQCEHASSLRETRSRLAGEAYGAILTAANLPDGDWKDVLNVTFDLGVSLAVIVTHRIADDRFWAEVLNLGCYDMLAQPFDTREVQRILALACARTMAKPMARAARSSKPLSSAA
jgi:DNA-binding NtrC family response regulator